MVGKKIEVINKTKILFTFSVAFLGSLGNPLTELESIERKTYIHGKFSSITGYKKTSKCNFVLPGRSKPLDRLL